MKTIRYFKLKNQGAFVARMKILWTHTDRAGRTCSGSYEPSGYHDICVGSERTIDLYDSNVPLDATVRLKVIVVWGSDNTAKEEFTFDSQASGMATYEISGTTLNNKLHLVKSPKEAVVL